MCRLAAEDGCEAMIATPHQRRGEWWNSDREQLAALAGPAPGRGGRRLPRPPRGRDPRRFRSSSPRWSGCRQGGILPLAGSRYLLIEFDSSGTRGRGHPPRPRAGGGRLAADRRPPRVHPLAGARPGLVARLVALGATAQVTAMSVTGDFGRRPQADTWTLLDAGLVHFVASDSHDTRRRPPGLRRAYRPDRRPLGRGDRRAGSPPTIPGPCVEDRPLPEKPYEEPDPSPARPAASPAGSPAPRRRRRPLLPEPAARRQLAYDRKDTRPRRAPAPRLLRHARRAPPARRLPGAPRPGAGRRRRRGGLPRDLPAAGRRSRSGSRATARGTCPPSCAPPWRPRLAARLPAATLARGAAPSARPAKKQPPRRRAARPEPAGRPAAPAAATAAGARLRAAHAAAPSRRRPRRRPPPPGASHPPAPKPLTDAERKQLEPGAQAPRRAAPRQGAAAGLRARPRGGRRPSRTRKRRSTWPPRAAYRISRWSDAATYFRRGGDPGEDEPERLFYMAVSLYESGTPPAPPPPSSARCPTSSGPPTSSPTAQKILGGQ